MTKRLQYALLHLIILIFPLDCTLNPSPLPSPLPHSLLVLSFLSSPTESGGDTLRWMKNTEGWLFSLQNTPVNEFKSRMEKGGTAKGTKRPFSTDKVAVLLSGQVTNPEQFQAFVHQKSCGLVPASRPRDLEPRTSGIKEAWGGSFGHYDNSTYFMTTVKIRLEQYWNR